MSMVHVGLLGIVCGAAGKLLIAYTTLMVHHRVRHEHQVDQEIFQIMKREQQLAFVGIVLIIAGAIMDSSVLLRLGL